MNVIRTDAMRNGFASRCCVPIKATRSSGKTRTARAFVMAITRAKRCPARTPAALYNVLMPNGINKTLTTGWLNRNGRGMVERISGVSSRASHCFSGNVDTKWMSATTINRIPSTNRIRETITRFSINEIMLKDTEFCKILQSVRFALKELSIQTSV